MMNPQDKKFYKEAGNHHPDTRDVNDCFMLNSAGTAKITCIKIWVVNEVYGLEVFYNGNTNGPKTGSHMLKEITPEVCYFQPGEDIIEIKGFYSNVIKSLTFVTSMGRTLNLETIRWISLFPSQCLIKLLLKLSLE